MGGGRRLSHYYFWAVCVCVCVHYWRRRSSSTSPYPMLTSHALQQQLHVWLRRARQCQCAMGRLFSFGVHCSPWFPPRPLLSLPSRQRRRRHRHCRHRHRRQTAAADGPTAESQEAARAVASAASQPRAAASVGARLGATALRLSIVSCERRPCASRLARRHSPVASSADRAPALCCCGTGTRQASSKSRSRRVVSLASPSQHTRSRA